MEHGGIGLPEDSVLLAGLSVVLSGSRSEARVAELVRRRPNHYASSSPSEIVTCRLEDGTARELLCKYAQPDGEGTHGHRGGGRREEAVQRHVLPAIGAPVPRFYGSHTDVAEARLWLVYEFVPGGVRLNKSEQPAQMLVRASEWIGRFHALAERRLAGGAVFPLAAYDLDYYAGWARRTSVLTRPQHGRIPWIVQLCERWREFAHLLLAEPKTVVHGEYYPHNVLVSDGIISPVDWESAALASGEVDLASITDGWPDEVARACESAYRQARWPEGAPPQFGRVLEAARVYLHLRWLGDRPEWTSQQASARRFSELLRNAEKLGLTRP